MYKQCPRCGAQMPEEASICLHCFYQTFTQYSRVRPKKNKNLRHRKCRIVLQLTCCAVMTLLTFVVLSAGSAATSAGESKTSSSPAAQQKEEKGKVQQFFQKLLEPIAESDTDETSSQVGDESDASAGAQSGSVITGETSTGSEDGAESSTTSGSTMPGSGLSKPEASTSDSTQAQPAPEYDSFEYQAYGSSGDKILITKYTGNASKVTVPAKIDGKYVVEVAKGAFADNSKITQIYFESDSGRSFLSLQRGCMSNLSALTTIHFPDVDLGITNEFAKNCLRLSNLDIENNQYRFIDGALYYWSSQYWLLRFYCPAAQNATLTVPSWCAGIEESCNLQENPYLKTVNYNEDCRFFTSIYPQQLEAINVPSGNTHATSKDGVLFKKSNAGKYTSSVYPACKKDKSFTVPENVILTTSSVGFSPNPYLETLRIPKSSTVGNTSSIFLYNDAFPNLKTVYLEEGSSLISYAQSHFTGDLIVY